MLVGEAPGRDEEAEGEPFVGKAGQFISRYFGRAGVPWPQVYRANLCPYRPHKNKFETLLGTDELQEGLKLLSDTIEKVDPNLIVAAGNWPMWYLTGQKSPAQRSKPGSGITSWRGSIMPGIGDFVPAAEGRKVLITYHPAYIIRPQGFGWHPVFFIDLQKIKKEMGFPEIKYPEYDSLIDPPNAIEVAEDMMESDWLTIDIETFGDSLACVGITDSIERGLCITFENPGGWFPARALLKSKAKKIFQYGAFDVNYMKHFYDWDTKNYAFDTYIAAANLMPEFPRGLDFLTSIYTPFPFYKEERKTWKNTGEMSSLWDYNIKDIIATHWIAMEQMKELEGLYG
jgi:uracil-DNA glycosylase family 4